MQSGPNNQIQASETSAVRAAGFGCAERGLAQVLPSIGERHASDSQAPLVLTLPTPPSVNQMYANRKKGGRHPTKLYVDWKGHAGWRLSAQLAAHKTLTCPVLAVVQVERASSQADIDNRLKALFDLLVTHGALADDNLITGYAVAWGPKGSGLCRVMMMPVQQLSLNFHPSADAATGGWFMAAQPEQEDATWP